MASSLFQEECDSLFLDTLKRRRVSVHPVVLFSILDHFSRRPEGQERVIGTLLGSVGGDGVVTISDSFPVPHTEVDTVAVDMAFHRNMMELHSKASPSQVMVGWYATGSAITDSSVMIHDFYFRETGVAPIHLTLDPLSTPIKAKAYSGESLTLGSTVGSLFVPVEASLSDGVSERLALELISRSKDNEEIGGETKQVEVALRSISQQLATLRAHAEAVASGDKKGDPAVGAALSALVQSLPALAPEQFDRLFNDGVQDLLMISYLAKLSRTQLALADKIQQL